MKKNIRPFNFFTLILLLAFIVLFFFVQSAYSNRFKDDFRDYEGKIDLGYFGLYTCILGKDKPSIIFEAGHNETHEIWKLIQPEISENSVTLSYDRAGVGQSDKTTNRRTSVEKAQELYNLLQQANVKGPYIIVAHSMGSWVSRVFAKKYTNEIAGLVFVDPTHEDTNDFILNLMPPEFLDQYKEQIITEGSYEDMIESIDQVKETRNALLKIPLTIISSTDHKMGPDFEEKWVSWQKDIASLSSKSKHITVDCGHNIQLEKPEVIIEAVKDMIDRINRYN